MRALILAVLSIAATLLAASNVVAQQVTVSTPQNTVTNSFFERQALSERIIFVRPRQNDVESVIARIIIRGIPITDDVSVLIVIGAIELRCNLLPSDGGHAHRKIDVGNRFLLACSIFRKDTICGQHLIDVDGFIRNAKTV